MPWIHARRLAIGAAVSFLAAASCGDSGDFATPDGGTDATGLDVGTLDAGAVDVTAESGSETAAADSAQVEAGVSPDAASTGCVPPTSTSRLLALKVAAPPVLDGVSDDAAWQCAPVLQVTLDVFGVYTPENAATPPAYPGLTRTRIDLRSVYTATDVYFLASWADPTRSLARLPWQKRPDGTWKQLMNPDSSKHENTYYEDKFAVQWNINSPKFAAVGCVASCHSKVSNAVPGKKYNSSGELTDLWHWKSVRTEPNGQIDDGYVADPGSGKCEGLNCRLSDGKTAGGYKDNNKAGYLAACPGDPGGAGPLPCFMGPPGAEIVKDDRYWIADTQKQPFVDTFMPGARVAGIVTSPFVGGRGDVATKARWAGGTWTLEIKRALTTAAGQAEDVQFADLTKAYEFGVAVFDNSQINHAGHETVLKLTFSP